MASLWGDEFNIAETQSTAKQILKKINEPKSPKTTVQKTINSKAVRPEEKLQVITAEVNRILGSYKKDTIVIKGYDDFVSYVDCCVKNGYTAVDTETNKSLDPFTCKLVGLCLYTPNQRNAYIPVNHVNLYTNTRLDWQVTEEQIKEQLDRLKDTNLIFHNSKFDTEVLECTCGCKGLVAYWDTQTASRMLNENESARLKDQYRTHINPEQEKYDIEHLFNSVDYEIVDPEIFALYAATDPYITYKLYEWQKAQFSKSENQRIFDIFMNVEMKVIPVFKSMEMNGISLDEEYAKRLSLKYHEKLKEIDRKLAEEMNNLKPQIDAWKKSPEAQAKTVSKSGALSKKSKVEQLEDPISLTSTTQLAILLYDILKVRVVDKQNPRGTGKDILDDLAKDVKLCELMAEQRKLLKLIDAFIDTLPSQRSIKDNKIHCSYNPIGADTGRVSCSEPNLQQIPSKNKEIRMLFKADEGKVFVGADFSQQEPRLLAAYSQDPTMIESYKNNRDLYAVMGQSVYHNKYEDNLEHYPDGSKYEEGTKRRKAMKSVLLGIMYGMGSKTLSESIGTTKDEAQEIINNFYKGFPKVKEFISQGEKFARTHGYVEDFWGRQRRLPNATLPDWVVESKNALSDFNPLLGVRVSSKPNELATEYLSKLLNCKYKRDSDAIRKEAESKGLIVHDNSFDISKAMRQCTNARIQGSASTMTKKAMVLIYKDELMNELGFELLLAVHDELIGQCPVENAEKVAERLSYLMSNCVPETNMPFQCDAEIETSWYLNTYSASILKEYKDMIKKGNQTPEECFESVCSNHIECTREQLIEFCELK